MIVTPVPPLPTALRSTAAPVASAANAFSQVIADLESSPAQASPHSGEAQPKDSQDGPAAVAISVESEADADHSGEPTPLANTTADTDELTARPEVAIAAETATGEPTARVTPSVLGNEGSLPNAEDGPLNTNLEIEPTSARQTPASGIPGAADSGSVGHLKADSPTAHQLLAMKKRTKAGGLTGQKAVTHTSMSAPPETLKEPRLETHRGSDRGLTGQVKPLLLETPARMLRMQHHEAKAPVADLKPESATQATVGDTTLKEVEISHGKRTDTLESQPIEDARSGRAERNLLPTSTLGGLSSNSRTTTRAGEATRMTDQTIAALSGRTNGEHGNAVVSQAPTVLGPTSQTVGSPSPQDPEPAGPLSRPGSPSPQDAQPAGPLSRLGSPSPQDAQPADLLSRPGSPTASVIANGGSGDSSTGTSTADPNGSETSSPLPQRQIPSTTTALQDTATDTTAEQLTPAPAATSTTSLLSTARPIGGAQASADPTPLATPVSFGELATTMRAQVAQMRTVSDAQRHIIVRLDPPELGALTLDLRTVGDEVLITARTDTAEAARALLRQRADMQVAIQSLGLALTGFDVRSETGSARSDRWTTGRRTAHSTDPNVTDSSEPTTSDDDEGAIFL